MVGEVGDEPQLEEPGDALDRVECPEHHVHRFVVVGRRLQGEEGLLGLVQVFEPFSDEVGEKVRIGRLGQGGRAHPGRLLVPLGLTWSARLRLPVRLLVRRGLRVGLLGVVRLVVRRGGRGLDGVRPECVFGHLVQRQDRRLDGDSDTLHHLPANGLADALRGGDWGQDVQRLVEDGAYGIRDALPCVNLARPLFQDCRLAPILRVHLYQERGELVEDGARAFDVASRALRHLVRIGHRGGACRLQNVGDGAAQSRRRLGIFRSEEALLQGIERSEARGREVRGLLWLLPRELSGCITQARQHVLCLRSLPGRTLEGVLDRPLELIGSNLSRLLEGAERSTDLPDPPEKLHIDLERVQECLAPRPSSCRFERGPPRKSTSGADNPLGRSIGR